MPRRHLTPNHENRFGRTSDVLWLDPADPLLLEERLWATRKGEPVWLVPDRWTVEDCLRLAWHQHELVLAARRHLGIPGDGLAAEVRERIRKRARPSLDSVRRKVRGEWPLTVTDLLVWPKAIGLDLPTWMPAGREPPFDPAGAARLGLPPQSP